MQKNNYESNNPVNGIANMAKIGLDIDKIIIIINVVIISNQVKEFYCRTRN